ncbi:MAG: ABC transporter ATP-binding protein [Phycisphaerae bacterium]
MASVNLDRISKTYPGNKTKSVDGVSVDIADREFLVVVGPSGCGKSTVLRMVAGLEAISEGTIRIGDRVVNDLAPKDRDVAMVFQNYALYPHMNVFKNMAFGLKMRKVPKNQIEAKVGQAAKMLNIEHLLHRKPKALSGGERQRVAVGRAIVRTPRAFLFDEPLSNLDARLRIQMRAELKRLHRTLQTTTIYVTHDQEEAMTLGDRMAVMREGLLQQCASPLEVYHTPANRFVAGFVGIPPMNFFDGQIVADNGTLMFDTGFGLLHLPDRVIGPLQNAVGSPKVYGARPESLTLAPTDANTPTKNGSLCMVVSVIEPLGSDKDVYMHTPDGQQVVARVEALAPIDEGAKVTVSVTTAQAHVFEPGVTGINIGL